MIVAGFGFRGAAEAGSLSDALARTGFAADVQALATADDKAAAPAFVAFADALDLPIHPICGADLSETETTTDSPTIRDHRQTGSVAEAAALFAAGPGAKLLCARVISQDRMATCAIARAPIQGEPE
ncbi:cobalamin biosynthesis protein [Aliishimia ponticola]|uniref:Cobalamin biosynthesis protein n=2 Tax=Aliishimia ponticola TaxID=2499833 RepID=A0A4S4NHK8_9RHOB|nr:cobalamin biosynthesis protein [Aliishimia ponticola]THH39172.1 cobalamin biosynthesis protein [Aliishimia ponticola]